MDAQAPLVAAASVIKKAAIDDPVAYTNFTGTWFDGSTLVVSWKGSVPKRASAVAAAQAAVPTRLESTKFSRIEYRAKSQRALDYIKDHPESGLHSVRIPISGDQIILGANLANAASASSTAVAARGRAKASIAADTALPVAIEDAPAPAVTSRADDTPPYWGGANVKTPTGSCTSGFAVRTPSGSGLLTAGHCGYNGFVFYNGNWTGVVGTGQQKRTAHDWMLIGTYDNYVDSVIYTGGGSLNGRAQSTRSVVGWTSASPQQWLCHSGAVGGEECSFYVQPNFQYGYCSDGACFNDLVTARKVSWALSVYPGDSGGPVYLPSGSNGALAVGVTQGTDCLPLCGNPGSLLIFQDLVTVYWDLGGGLTVLGGGYR